MRLKIQIIVVSVYLLSCSKNMEGNGMEEAMIPIKVEIRKEGDAFRLYRGGAPYSFNGAGLNGDIGNLKSHGGNSIRTWDAGNEHQSGLEILDEAEENGMTVFMCFYMQPERHGMDYENEELVAQQFEKIRRVVLKHKDHPALLAWCIGNEMNHSYSNPRVYDAVNEISKWIHEVDPNHPTTTAVASFSPNVVKEVKERASDIDFISIQVYGELHVLQDMIRNAGWTKPYMVTEWGAIGHWEMPATEWGAPIEQTSSQKAANYLKGYKKSIEPYANQCLGNYVFLWGQKQERTPTWYGLFLESGEETEVIDVMHYIWNDKWPANRATSVAYLKLDGKQANENVYLKPGNLYEADFAVKDIDEDELSFRWVIMRESSAIQEGGDREEIPEKIFEIERTSESAISFSAPDSEGAYRLFAYTFDGNGHASHANIPFYVKN